MTAVSASYVPTSKQVPGSHCLAKTVYKPEAELGQTLNPAEASSKTPEKSVAAIMTLPSVVAALKLALQSLMLAMLKVRASLLTTGLRMPEVYNHLVEHLLCDPTRHD